MQETGVNVRRLNMAGVWLFLGLALLDAKADGVVSPLDAGLVRMRAARQKWAEKLAIPPANGFANGCLDLVLTGALDRHDLSVQLLCRDGRWIEGSATTPYTPYIGTASVANVAISGTSVKGEMTVCLGRMDVIPRSVIRTGDGRMTPLRYALDLRIDNRNAVKGTATLKNPEVVPGDGTPVKVAGRWVPVAEPGPLASTPPEVVREQAALAVEEAHLLYEQILAMQVQQEQGIPYAIAVSNVAHWRPMYPKLEDEAPTARMVPKTEKIPDIDDLGNESEALAAIKAAAVAKRKERAVVASNIVDHIADLCATVEAALGATQDVVQIGDADCGDPDFGPFCPATSLESVGSLTNKVPADPVAAGTQSWPFIGRWAVLGPFPQNAWRTQARVLPDIVPDFRAGLVAETNRLPGIGGIGGGLGRYYGTGFHTWTWVAAEATTGLVIPPLWQFGNKYPTYGKDWGAFYAVCVLESPRDAEFWAAMVTGDGGSVWVNDRLVWQSSLVPHWNNANTFRFRMPLRKGPNRLLVRCDSLIRPHDFKLHLCTAGAPRDAAEVASTAADRDAAYSTIGTAVAGAQGWRRDHTGVWPEAHPVAAWNIEKKINVQWEKPLRYNCGGLILVDGKVVTTEDPVSLVCLDAKDGAILWRHDLDPLELANPAKAAEARGLRDKLHATSDATERGPILAALAKLSGGEAGCNFRWTEIEGGYSGNAMATPVTDGKWVWAKIGSSVVGCMDLEGKRRWARQTGAEGGGMGHPITSPMLLTPDKGRRLLICQVPRYVRTPQKAAKSDDDDDGEAQEGGGRGEEWNAGRRMILKAWDAETGEPVWESMRYGEAHFGNRYDADGIATPLPMRLANGKEILDVIVTVGGFVFRAADGVVVNRNIGIQGNCASPMYGGRGVALFPSGCASARMILVNRDRVDVELQWQANVSTRGWTIYGGWGLAQGRVYGFNGGPDFGLLYSLDATTGANVKYLIGIFSHPVGNNYMPPAVGGDRLFVADDNRPGYNGSTAWAYDQAMKRGEKTNLPKPLPGGMSVFQTGREPLLLARNTFSGITMSPVFDGDRMYARMHHSVICIGPTGEAGRRYEVETVARTILAGMQIAAPDDSTPVEPPAFGVLPPGFEVTPIEISEFAPVMVQWNVVAPIAPAEEAGLAKTLEFSKGLVLPRGGAIEGVNRKIRGLLTHHMAGIYPSPLLADRCPFGVQLDLTMAHEGQAGSIGLWSTILYNDRPRTVRIQLDSKETEFFIGGTKIADNQRIRLARGNYVFSMRTRLPEGPGPHWIAPRMWPSDDVAQERARRKAQQDAARPHLERVIKEVPDSEIAEACRRALEM
jgi:outer membrane protein assembly factor BamB